jgi:hypothetical protein
MVGKLKVAKGLKVTVKVNEYQSLELSRGTSHSILKRLSANPPWDCCLVHNGFCKV